MSDIVWREGIMLPHDPSASEIYRMDFTDWLEEETISANLITAETGITAALVTQGAAYIDFRVSGGTAGNIYRVTIRATSNALSRVQERSVLFNCFNR
ncbi:MAG TPA: hypothetical protein DCO82_10160 [Alphaproteobacteria bacterium]|nr:hypothetical protein [Alphaproteobacteria bacterium]